jgi:hypothetical protein
VWACRGGVRQARTGCGHVQVEFGSLELGVGMYRQSSAGSNWVWAYRGGVWQDRTGCGHAEVEFSRIELSNSARQFDPAELHLCMPTPSSCLLNSTSACPHPVRAC